MSDPTISRFPVPDLDDLPPDIADRLRAVQEKAGFIPNIFLTFAYRPAEFRAFIAYHDALMEKDEGLTKAEREMIVVATSSHNHCQYCVIAHGAILRVRARDPLIADTIAVNYRKANLSPRHRTMLDHALKVTAASHTLEDADFDRLAEAGFTEDEIWDIGAIAAFFAMGNRLANMASARPNAEFHTIGRDIAPTAS